MINTLLAKLIFGYKLPHQSQFGGRTGVRNLIALMSIISIGLLAGCAGNHIDRSSTSSQSANIDPFEKYNRPMFRFDMALTNHVFDPVVKTYNKAIPSMGRQAVHNVFANFQMVPTIGNDCLQGNFRWAGQDIIRLFLNTTLGGLGLIDVASGAGFYPRSQSFGLTLAKWGVRDTPYLVLPLIGPSSVSETIGLVPDFFMNPVNYIGENGTYWGIQTVQYVQIASDVLPQVRFITDNALDPYVAMRNAYLQNRHYLMEEVDQENTEPQVQMNGTQLSPSSDLHADKTSKSVLSHFIPSGS